MKFSKAFSLFVAACLMSVVLPTQSDSQTLTADIVIVNANVHTLNNARPAAEAVAIYGNRIVAVGTSVDVRKLAGAQTRVIDAHGALVMPGFHDAHVHFIDGGFHLSSVSLRDASSPEEFAARIREFAARTPKGRWITGGDWDHERWPGAPLPTRELIDKFTPDNPVFINRLDGHMSLANSVALKLAGVTRETKDPPGGLIVRDAQGEPTGVLKDAAMSFVYAKIPDPSLDERLDALRAATNHAASLGVTSVQDMSAGDDVAVYQLLARRGELKTRVYAVRSITTWEVLRRAGVLRAYGNDLIRIGGLKGFADGSLGSTTALFFEPYNDAPAMRGLLGDEMQPEGVMLERVMGADAVGLQVMIHAIGDAANDRILSIYEAVEREHGARDRRFRIEHAQHLRAQDIARFAKDHVVASMQPYHCIDDGRWAEKRIGHERARTTYAFRSLLDAGATLAFGTDWFVAPLNPMFGIYAAVTRRTLDGKNPQGWIPEQKITVEEAVRAYTIGSAFAEFTNDVKGTLTPGKLADLIIVDRDIFKIDPVEIEHAKVRLTIMDGRVVYEAAAQ
jgi:predicted amidohydrolase YtcJ